jgi:anthranilate synthase component 2
MKMGVSTIPCRVVSCPRRAEVAGSVVSNLNKPLLEQTYCHSGNPALELNDTRMLLVIDNYDSFTYNLVQYFGQMGVEQRIFRNDEITAEQALALNPDRVLLSPGPCSPAEAGVTLDMIRAFAGKKPIFGVCLGHQAVGHYFGGKVVRAKRLMHGKTSPILHRNTDLFKGMPVGFEATRYHSLLVERETFPPDLEITAETAEGEVMGLRHRHLPIWGVQFHPESIATQNGMKILENFMELN